jgi:hypothetical protein
VAGRLGDDLDLRLVDLDAAGRLRGGDGAAGHRQHGLGRERGDSLRLPTVAHDDLRHAAAIADDQERDPAEPPLAMQPSGEPDGPTSVLAELASEDPSHQWHLQSS